MDERERTTRTLITLTGPDRPGLIAAVAQVLADEGVDLEDLSMTRLSGNFATMILARGSEPDRWAARLRQVAAGTGLTLHVEPAVEQDTDQVPSIYVTAIGPNRTGIVAGVSAVLARHGANILELSTRLLNRTATPVYYIRLDAVCAAESEEPLRVELTAAMAPLGVDVRVERVDPDEL